MLRSVFFMLAVSFTVSGDPVEKESERIIIGDALHRVPPLEAMDTSNVDLDEIKARKKELKEDPAQLRANNSPRKSARRERERKMSQEDVGIPPKLTEKNMNMFGHDSKKRGRQEKRKSTTDNRNRMRDRARSKKGPGKKNTFSRNAEARRANRPKRTKPRFAPAGLHKFDISTAHGTTLRLNRGAFPDAKVFLLVNTASESEFSPQYAELETLWNEWRHKGLQIIAFPSNSFNQEPLSDNEIQKYVRETYRVTYPVMAKCEVTGDETIELYKWLTKNSNRDGKVPEWAPIEESGLKRSDVQWNFEKFIVYNRREGQVIIRFDYDYAPKELAKFVERGILVHDKAKVELR